MSTKSAIHSSNNLNLCDSLFESLLYQIKASKLNYKIEESPFSAVIFLKRSLIKDKFGNFLQPQNPAHQVLVKDSEVSTLKDELAEKEEQLKELKSRNKILQASAKNYAKQLKDKDRELVLADMKKVATLATQGRGNFSEIAEIC